MQSDDIHFGRVFCQQLKEIKNLGVIHFQETHLITLKEIEECFLGLKGKIMGASLNPEGDHKQGIFSWVPSTSPIYDLIQEHEVGLDGRWATLRIAAIHEEIFIGNVYFPSDSEVHRKKDLPNLML